MWISPADVGGVLAVMFHDFVVGRSFLILACLFGVCLHSYSLRRAQRETEDMRRIGISPGGMILVEQNKRSELGRLHLKAAIAIASSIILLQPALTQLAFLIMLSGVLHLDWNSYQDIADRRRIIEAERVNPALWNRPAIER